jgi:hypothetical protein
MMPMQFLEVGVLDVAQIVVSDYDNLQVYF